MSIQLQLRRGNTTENQNFTGAEGEVTINTQTHELVVHDGSTKGGHQIPTMDQVQAEIANIPSIYYTPNVDANGIISWTNNGNLENPETRNIKGPRGPQGPQGQRGQKGAAGDTGHTTNCITEIPQNIKLELENGEVTLKSGSKIYTPNGSMHIPTIDEWNIQQNNVFGNTEWSAIAAYPNYISDYQSNTVGFMIIGDNGVQQCINQFLQNDNQYTASGLVYKNNGLTRTPTPYALGTYSWRALAFDGSKYVALSNRGYVSTAQHQEPYTSNAINWTTPVENINLKNCYWVALTYDGSKFIALSKQGFISTSTDGLTWTVANQNNDLGNHSWGSIIYDGTKYIAIGGNYQTLYTATSTDCENWVVSQKEYTTNTHTTDEWVGVAYDNTKYIAISAYGHISTSTDGSVWTTPIENTSLGISNSGIFYINQTVYGNPKFVVIKKTGDFCFSEEAENWTKALNLQEYAYNRRSNVIYDGEKFVFCRSNGNIFTSTDGINWTPRPGLDGSRDWSNIVFDGTQYLSISTSERGLGRSCNIATSTDLMTWNIDINSDLTKIYSNSIISHIIYDGEKYIVKSGATATFATSVDGVSWQQKITSLQLRSGSFKYANGIYIMLTAEGQVSTSRDLINWTDPIENTNIGQNTWTDIVYDGEKFIAISASGYISTSVNGSIWTTPTQNQYLAPDGNEIKQWMCFAYNGTKVLGISSACRITETDPENYTAIPEFLEVTTTQDITYGEYTTTSGDFDYILFNNGEKFLKAKISSGETDRLSGESNHVWYDTVNNQIKVYGADGTTFSTTSFPIGEIVENGGVVKNITKIYNGCGYIGTIIYMLPGTSGLIPNGRSENGDLNNTEFITPNVIIFEPTNATNEKLLTDGVNMCVIPNDNVSYNLLINKNISNGSAINKAILGNITKDNNSISSFNIKNVFFIEDANN